VFSDAEGVEQFAARLLLAFSERIAHATDVGFSLISFASPRAIIFVAFSDFKEIFSLAFQI
jgi:hypothetical protein